MKLFFYLITTTLLLTACSKPDLKSEKGRISYALGQQLVQNFKDQKVEIDSTILAASIKDAFNGHSEMSKEEIHSAMMKLQKASMIKQASESEANKINAEKIFEQNKNNEGVKTTASGLQYKIIKEGEGAIPKKEDVVRLHYVGTLVSGETFDSSIDRKTPAEFPVNGVIHGWSEALQMMKVGSKYKIFVPANLAYGTSTRPGIPANSALIFEMELLDIVKNEIPAKRKE